eukprot:189626-Pyramimonas_sp.AAC.1
MSLATGVEDSAWVFHRREQGSEEPDSEGADWHFPVEERDPEPSGAESQGEHPSPQFPAPGTKSGGLSGELQREVARLHANLGHPRDEDFLRALRVAGARPE